jgi:hypothetical protein
MAGSSPTHASPREAFRSVSRRLAAASHDLQQPLQAMGLLIEALARHDLPAEAAAIVERLGEAHDATRALLMAMLDLSRLETGHVRPDFTVMPVDEILADLKATYRPIAADKGVLLRFIPCSAVVRTDGMWIVRILGNLIANALAHSGSDRIVVGCRRRDGDLRIEVRDRGIGMDPAHLEAALSGVGAGAGMGLAIAAAATTLLGHLLEGDTAEGAGTAFAVTLPLADET